MADIRINALATTAASTASDDFIAIDGSANGTRKLNAYSPTFGGNLTVSGVTTSAGVSNSGALTFTAAAGQIAGSIAKNATYGLTYYGVTGSSNDNTMLNASGAVVLSNPAGTTNATLAGNLTVSGRDLTIGSSESVIYFGTPSANYLYYNGSSLFLRVGSVDRITIPASTGNVLIGTTTDGGQKLQVNGTIRSGSGSGETLSAGSIDVGADIGIASTQGIVQGGARIVAFTSGNATFAGDVGLSGNEKYLNLFSTYIVGSNSRARLRAVGSGGGSGYGGSFTVDTRTSGNTFITALTIDDAQNATFNGTILASSATGFVLNLSDTRSQAAGNGASIGLRGTYTGSSQTNFAAVLGLKVNSTDGNYAGKMVLQTRPNGGALTDALTLDDSQNATFAGSIAINNTVQTAVAVASTHKVTISIGGTTYYLLATNV